MESMTWEKANREAADLCGTVAAQLAEKGLADAAGREATEAAHYARIALLAEQAAQLGESATRSALFEGGNPEFMSGCAQAAADHAYVAAHYALLSMGGTENPNHPYGAHTELCVQDIDAAYRQYHAYKAFRCGNNAAWYADAGNAETAGGLAKSAAHHARRNMPAGEREQAYA